MDSPESQLVPAVGFTLAHRTYPDAGRWCTGDPDGTGCPNRAKNTDHNPNSRYCVSCAVDQARAAADLHHAHTRDRESIAPEMQDHLAGPNILYVAGFRDGSMKVGTSTARRIEVRLAEQGAWAARVVGVAANGFVVRELEDQVTAELGLAQSVNVGRKLSGLANPTDDHTLEQRLDRAVAAIRELPDLDRAVADRQFQFDQSCSGGPVDGTWHNPVAGDSIWDRRPLYPYPVAAEDGVHHLTIRAVCGRVTVVERPGSPDLFLMDLGPFYGVELQPGPWIPSSVRVQGALF